MLKLETEPNSLPQIPTLHVFIIWGLLIIKPLLSATLLLTTMTDWVIYVMLFSLYYLTNGSQVDGDDEKKVQKHLQDTWNLSLDSKL